MSYCRWSSDDYRCDLYCYESDLGYRTHVAALRVPDDTPRLPLWGTVPDADFFEASRQLHHFLDGCVRTPIGLPCDGQSFVDFTLAELRDRLLALRAMGYRFPDSVLDAVEVDARLADP